MGLIPSSATAGRLGSALALGVEAIRRGRAVMFFALADLIETLVRAEREGVGGT